MEDSTDVGKDRDAAHGAQHKARQGKQQKSKLENEC